MHRSMLIAACGLTLAAGTPELLAQTPDLGAPLVGEGLAEAWWVEDEFVVRLAAGVDRLAASQASDATGRFGLKALDRTMAAAGVVSMRQLFPGSHQPGVAAADPAKLELCGYWVVRIDRAAIDRDTAMRTVSRDPSVAAVEPIGVHPVAQSGPITPNDPNFGNQWYLNQFSDADIDAPEGWGVAVGNPGVIVAVADTGVRYYHRDLGGSSGSPSNPFGARGNLWINQAEANGIDGVDDDGNGFIDDKVGWDFVSDTSSCTAGEDCSGADNDPRDFDGHGTHCAGIVAAISNNGTGVASPAGGWNSGSLAADANGVRIMSLRIGWDPGYIRMDFAASAMYYAANQGARIISCSWGSSNSGGLGAATTYFINAGGMVFTAAGNSNNQTASYLAGRSDVWSVASTANNDTKSGFSSYGSWVDIAAPGSSIYSTYHNSGSPNSDVYASLSGTSMATPLVASVAATVWAANPSLNAAAVWAAVRDSADNIDSLNPGYIGLLGSGRVNLHNALLAAGGGDGGGGGPVNDDCAGAITIAEGSTPFDTASATDSASALPAFCDEGAGTSLVADLWFRHVAADTGTLTVSTCGEASFDTRIAVYDGGCGNSMLVACNDDAPGCAGYTSTASFAVVGGVEYLIRLGGYSGSGNGTLTLSLEVATCGDPEAGDCCSPNGTPGCSDADCCATVCAADPTCCDLGWDQTCAELAGMSCGPCAPSTGTEIWMALSGSPSLPGVGTVAASDLVAYNLVTGGWRLVFRGANVGVGSRVIDAAARTADGDLLLSFTAAATLPGLTGAPSGTSFDDSDILRFRPTATGSGTAGSWFFHFDGSDVGLTTNGEDLSALGVLPDGRLLISTNSGGSVPGAGSFAAQDLLVFSPTSLGSNTSGTWSWHFDGSDVALSASSEKVDAAAVMPDGRILLSTTGNFSVAGASGNRCDLFGFDATSTGSATSGSFEVIVRRSEMGLPSTSNVIGCFVVPGS